MSLAHNIDEYWLQEGYSRTRKGGAVGVDGTTAEQYAEHLEANLRSLLDRFKSGQYQAPPVKRIHIPKGNGSQTRPIGIPSFEDKVLQRAVAMVLEAIYEEDFLPCSYGFRPGRSAHNALRDLWLELMGMSGGWVLEVDIRSFFDELDHGHLRTFLDRRVRDGVIRRAIGKWLQAGVLEEGRLRHPVTGTPQGGVISPLLANIYLHEVVDRWFEEEVKPRLAGRAVLIRYADDLVIAFASERDARRVLEALPKRLSRFGLQLHPDKTGLVRFQMPRGKQGPPQSPGPGTFTFLGFTHYWGKSRKGNWAVKRKTAASRLTRSLCKVREWCRRRLHEPVPWQQRQLSRALRGHYAYYGITGNYRALNNFHRQVTREWRRWLNRRSQKAKMVWERFNRLLIDDPLPRPRIVHAIRAAQRSRVTRSRMREIRTSGSVGGPVG
jgi:group II intron reverse transcriptase/maturase